MHLNALIKNRTHVQFFFTLSNVSDENKISRKINLKCKEFSIKNAV